MKERKVKQGMYLVDNAGQIRYYIDPTITGVLKERDDWVADNVPAINLKDDLNNLKETVKLPSDGPGSVCRRFTSGITARKRRRLTRT